MSASGADRPRRRQAVVALLAVTVLWGCTFVWSKQSLDAAQARLGHPGGAPVIALYVAVRFSLAAALIALWPKARRGLDRGAWLGGACLGVLLFTGFVAQMLGLEHVSPPVSAFLTSLYVVFAAILSAAIHRARPHWPFIAGVVLATFGAGFIEGPPHLTFGLAEWLTVACAFIFAIHILATAAVTRDHPPVPVTLAMFVWTAALSAAAFPILMARPGAPATADLFALLSDRAFMHPLLLSTVFATVVALTIMNQFQRELDPVRAAILFALEPIWATGIAVLYGFDSPGPWLLIGGGALLAGNLIAELGVKE